MSLRADSAPIAHVFNSYPYSTCPQEKWAALSTTRLAAETDVTAVVRTGPRYWAIDGVQKFRSTAPQTRSLGGVTMAFDGVLDIANILGARTPYTAQEVTRDTIFDHDRGRRVYELIAPDGTRYVMQSYSQQIEPTLDASDLPALGRRLTLPTGWRYRTRPTSGSGWPACLVKSGSCIDR